MAIRNVGGHAVTNMATNHHQWALPAQPKFVPTQGPADHQSPKGGRGFNPGSGAKKGVVNGPYNGQ